MKRFSVLLAATIALCVLAGHAQAELIDNGDGTVTQIRNDGSVLMWLKDANYPSTSGYFDGGMTWPQAIAWVEYLNSIEHLGHDDWRLPVTLPINGTDYNLVGSFGWDGTNDRGYNITSPNSEMSYMYYVELGNLGYYDINGYYQMGWGLNNTGPFINLQDHHYWSATEFVEDISYAWNFNFGYGIQNDDPKTGSAYAWPVRGVSGTPDEGPDLAVTCKAFFCRDFGRSITVNLWIDNKGNEDAGAFWIALYRNMALGELLDERIVLKGLRTGHHLARTLRYSSEDSLSGAYIVAVVDSEGEILEVDEANNRKVIWVP